MSEKVSIIIPLFNREILIVETLKSLYNQSYENWEAIVVDDHSNDGSYKAVEQETLKDNRVRLYKRDTQIKGAPSCRNIGIERATGKFIIFLDSDDILAPYALEERTDYFKKHSDEDYLVFNSSFFTESLTDSRVLWNVFTEENDLNRFLRGDNVWCISSPIWKRQSIVDHKLLFMETAKSSQDWEFHVKALHKKMTYQKIDGLPDFFIRRNTLQGSNAISSSHGDLNKFVNRLQLYASLFSEFRLTEVQSDLLFANIESEVFNIYHKLSFKELKMLKSEIAKIKTLSRLKLRTSSSWYVLLFRLTRLTFNKSHQFVYYFKKYMSSKNQKVNYRTPMSDAMRNSLLHKLEQFLDKPTMESSLKML